MTVRLGVCSWSVEPRGPDDLVAKVRSCGISAVQLALDPIRTGAWNEGETVAALRGAGIGILSGMMGTVGEDYSTLDSIRVTGGIAPDATWPANLAAAGESAGIAQRLGITLVTFHAGFLPHDSKDPKRLAMIDRLRQFAEVFAGHGVRLAFETGQESAGTLLGVLSEVNSALGATGVKTMVGVNFDPANMILYGMGEPVDAMRALAPAIRQIHIKDANPTKTPGTWGEEVAVGTGGVDWKAFFGVYKSVGMDSGDGIDLVIEREAGQDRIGDIKKAKAVVEKLV
ncbi:MAG: sugar phosphate isomerase/epimerase [Phycisphaerales bacterium]|nr:sugar phosphate isomerase/epimerase [Phycisphaerales bacterium]